MPDDLACTAGFSITPSPLADDSIPPMVVEHNMEKKLKLMKKR
jgi:hypothetical protein